MEYNNSTIYAFYSSLYLFICVYIPLTLLPFSHCSGTEKNCTYDIQGEYNYFWDVNVIFTNRMSTESEKKTINTVFYFAACHCLYRGKLFNNGDTIYATHDGNGACITAICDKGEIIRIIETCTTTTPPTTTPLRTTTSFIFGKKKIL